LLRFVFEPLIQFRKFAVVEVSPGDAHAIDIAASLVECFVGQRAPQVDANEIPMQNRGKIGGHRFQKVGQILGDILREVHFRGRITATTGYREKNLVATRQLGDRKLKGEGGGIDVTRGPGE